MGFPLFLNFRCNYQVSIRKWQIAPEFKADGGFEPIWEYFEDSDSPSNAEMGCKMPFAVEH